MLRIDLATSSEHENISHEKLKTLSGGSQI